MDLEIRLLRLVPIHERRHTSHAPQPREQHRLILAEELGTELLIGRINIIRVVLYELTSKPHQHPAPSFPRPMDR